MELPHSANQPRVQRRFVFPVRSGAPPKAPNLQTPALPGPVPGASRGWVRPVAEVGWGGSPSAPWGVPPACVRLGENRCPLYGFLPLVVTVQASNTRVAPVSCRLPGRVPPPRPLGSFGTFRSPAPSPCVELVPCPLCPPPESRKNPGLGVTGEAFGAAVGPLLMTFSPSKPCSL